MTADPAPGDGAHLDVAGLSVDVAGHRIVADVDLAARRGELVGLLGSNGSGKSTLLKSLYRVHRPAAGTVLVDGDPLLGLPARDAARRMAVLTQDAAPTFDATVAEVVAVGRYPYRAGPGRAGDADRAAERAAVEAVGLTGLEHRLTSTLSGGELQRALIARMLAQDCDLLLLDEPTNHLDIRYQLEVLELVAERCRRGATAVAALHDLSLAGQFCDRVYLLSAGRVVAHGPPAVVITADRVREVYGADVLVLPHPHTGRPCVVPRRG